MNRDDALPNPFDKLSAVRITRHSQLLLDFNQADAIIRKAAAASGRSEVAFANCHWGYEQGALNNVSAPTNVRFQGAG